MNKTYDVITALDTCMDLIVFCGEAAPRFGQTEQRVKGYSLDLGGSCGIFASGCAKLGLKTAGVGVVGDDPLGAMVLDGLRKSGVDVSNVSIDPKTKTVLGVTLSLDDGDRAILASPGSVNEVQTEAFTEELLSQTRHLHIGNYYIMDQLISGWPGLLKKAKSYGVSVSLDTNWDPDERWRGSVEELYQYTDIFLPNENELMSLFGGGSIEEALAAAMDVMPIVAVKLGEKGAMAGHDGKTYYHEAYPAELTDNVGAGDNFDAGFIYGFLNGFDIQECLKAGCLCGSASISKPGGIIGQLYKCDIIA